MVQKQIEEIAGLPSAAVSSQSSHLLQLIVRSIINQSRLCMFRFAEHLGFEGHVKGGFSKNEKCIVQGKVSGVANIKGNGVVLALDGVHK